MDGETDSPWLLQRSALHMRCKNVRVKSHGKYYRQKERED